MISSYISKVRGRLIALIERLKSLNASLENLNSSFKIFVSTKALACFLFCWPIIWMVIAWLYERLPSEGSRDVFKDIFFTKYWEKYYKFSYIPNLRNIFFEYILTFYYSYPIKKGDTIIQIGASFGEETARFAKAVGKNGCVIAIEPESENIKKLSETFTQDKFPQVRIIPQGVWSEKREINFFVGGEREHRVAEMAAKNLTYEFWGVEDDLREERYKSTSVISVDTLDNILNKLSLETVDFILVETNGGEFEAVKGMNETFQKVNHLAVRGHVKWDGIPINIPISQTLEQRGFDTSINSEGIVLASKQVTRVS